MKFKVVKNISTTCIRTLKTSSTKKTNSKLKQSVEETELLKLSGTRLNQKEKKQIGNS